MPAFGSAVQFAVVTTLPSAASAPNAVLVQGGKLWFSNGTSWVDLGAAGGDGIDYVQGTTPASPVDGDTWIDTSVDPLARANHTGSQATSTITGLDTALNDRVRGTVRITVGTTAPSSPAVGDIWIDTN